MACGSNIGSSSEVINMFEFSSLFQILTTIQTNFTLWINVVSLFFNKVKVIAKNRSVAIGGTNNAPILTGDIENSEIRQFEVVTIEEFVNYCFTLMILETNQNTKKRTGLIYSATKLLDGLKIYFISHPNDKDYFLFNIQLFIADN